MFMIAVVDPLGVGAAEQFRGVPHESLVEVGYRVPLIVEHGEPTDIDPETLEEELAHLEEETSAEFIRISNPGLTEAQEARLDYLLETVNITEALRIMGVSKSDISGN